MAAEMEVSGYRPGRLWALVAGPLLALDLFTRPAVAAGCCRGAIDAGFGELDQSAVFDYVRTLA